MTALVRGLGHLEAMGRILSSRLRLSPPVSVRSSPATWRSSWLVGKTTGQTEAPRFWGVIRRRGVRLTPLHARSVSSSKPRALRWGCWRSAGPRGSSCPPARWTVAGRSSNTSAWQKRWDWHTRQQHIVGSSSACGTLLTSDASCHPPG